MKDAKGHGSNPRGAHAEGVNKIGQPLPIQQVSPQEFLAAQSQSTRAGYFTPHTPDELQGQTLLMTKDGKAGVAVNPNTGYAGGLFNNGAPKGTGGALFEEAKIRGARTGDCFGNGLANFYKAHGFKETGRYPFDPALAPPKWNYERDGKPDFITLELPPRAQRRREKFGRT